MNRAIHCKSGSSFMGQAVNSGIAPGIWNVLPFLITDAKSCIDLLEMLLEMKNSKSFFLHLVHTCIHTYIPAYL